MSASATGVELSWIGSISRTGRREPTYAGAVIFLGSILGGVIATGHAVVTLRGAAGLLLLIAVSAVVVIISIARSVAARSFLRVDDLSFILAWGLAAIWLMWGLALPSAVRRLRHGR